VVTLRIIGDLTLEQTAEVTGKTVASVKQLQRRGLLRLRELMAATEVAR
jgi:RNA polymerase sigma-70 factor (ECF subfamily)